MVNMQVQENRIRGPKKRRPDKIRDDMNEHNMTENMARNRSG